MESNSTFRQWADKFSEFLSEQEWYQQLKSKWEELDPNSRLYLKAAGTGAVVLGILLTVLSSVWRVHSLKKELGEKQELLTLIQSANEEMRRLRDTTGGASPATAPTGGWPAYVEGIAEGAGIAKDSLTISAEKAGTSSDTVKETLFDVSLKHVNIKQVVRMAHSLETGGRPAKLRNLLINTDNDGSGYMDATLAVSGFAMVNNK